MKSVTTWLSGQRPLSRVVPRLNDLRRDPACVLAREAVEIGPARGWPLLLGNLLLCAFLGAMIARVTGMVVGFGVGLAIGMLGWWRNNAYLRLDHAGVQIVDRRYSYRMPWSLFDAGGTVVNHMDVEARISINASALQALAQHNRAGSLVASGAAVKGWAVRVTESRELALKASFLVNINQLAILLQELGRALGGDGARVSAPQDSDPLPTLSHAGGFTARLTELVFPCRCCDCAATTDRLLEFFSGVRFGWVLRLLGTNIYARLWIPVCQVCERRYRWRARKGGIVGAAVGSGAFALLFLFPGLDPAARIALGILAVILGGIIGWGIGVNSGLPVSLSRYSPSKGTVDLRFRRRDYAEEVLDAIERARA